MAAPTDYERGLAEGKLTARIDDHARRLDAINGSVAATAQQLLALTQQIAGLTAIVQAQAANVAESVQARTKYVPILESLERRRLQGLKLWHVAAVLGALLLPQTLNLILRLSGLAG